MIFREGGPTFKKKKKKQTETKAFRLIDLQEGEKIRLQQTINVEPVRNEARELALRGSILDNI